MAERATVRALRMDAVGRLQDDDAVRHLFLTSMFLGSPNPFALAVSDRYTSVCLGWYLDEGRADAALAVDEHGRAIGYALVCTDGDAQASQSRRGAARLAIAVNARLLTGRLDGASRRFYGDRLRDSVALWRNQRTPPKPAHAHLNVVDGARSGRAAAALLQHIDQRCAAAGLDGWYGEINAREGSRERALARLGLEVVHRAPNHTLARAAGVPVVRLTVVRELTPATPPELAPALP